MLSILLFLLQICFICIQFKHCLASCEVFKTITTPDSEKRTIYQDFIDSSSFDYGIGIWTKYSRQYESIETIQKNTVRMFIFSDDVGGQVQLGYFITLDKIEKMMIHSLVINSDSGVLISELQVSQQMVGDRWVFLYFCYSNQLEIFNIFLYVTNEQENVQMQQIGLIQIKQQDLKLYQLGGEKQLNEVLSKAIGDELSAFAGEISDLDQRTGDGSFYQDIPTFLNNLQDSDCSIENCFTIQKIIITDLQIFDSNIIDVQTKITYFKSKFTLRGWVILDDLKENQSLESVFFRATLRKKYYDDQYQGDKALYWKYFQNNENNFQNGFEFTTYHHDPQAQFESYQTQESDSWIVKNEVYKNSLTFWHYFIYQEGIDDPNYNIQLKVYFGQNKNELDLTMRQNHYDHSKLYFTFGKDDFNNNFRGKIRNLSFIFCYDDQQIFQRECHYSCKSCFGPLSSNCLDCFDSTSSKRSLNKGTCGCVEGYIDIGSANCKQKQAILKNINIKESLDQNIKGCPDNHFEAIIDQISYCLKCPGTKNEQILECVECNKNPLTWYLNPICQTDYQQPKLDGSNNYVFLEKKRNQVDFEYYLINKDTNQINPQLELCYGCLNFNNTSTVNYVEQFNLNKLIKIICKTCYVSLNNECFNINQKCLECDENSICMKCNTNYTLFQNECHPCPDYCPDCFMNASGQFCNSCIEGYYYNSTQQNCQQCGQFCQTCIQIDNFDFLICLKCINIIDYFISADFRQCRQKNMDHCIIQAEEQVVNFFQNYSIDHPRNELYTSTLDVRTTNLTANAYSVCILCENNYINKMFIFQDYKCIHFDDVVELPNLPLELKKQVANSINNSFQLGYTNYKTIHYGIISGQPVTVSEPNSSNISQIINVEYRSTIESINYQKKQENCSDQFCVECVKNFIWSLDFCIKCMNGYYPNIYTGICYKCPQTCKECKQSFKHYNDEWKWDVLPYYIFRSNIIDGFHNYQYFSASTDIEYYEAKCTSCSDDGYLHDGKCYPHCGCETCLFYEGKSICLSCPNNIQTYQNGKCIDCPNQCALCRFLEQNEIAEINPYFQSNDETNYKFAKQCLKQSKNNQPNLNLYHDMSLGLEVLCTENQQCFKYLEIPLNLYCSDEKFIEFYQMLTDEESQDIFLSENIKLSEIFSTSFNSHFQQIESNYLYTELNKNTVKLIRLQLKIKPNSGDCVISSNTFIKSNFQVNVFPLQYQELVIESSLDIPIYFGKNISIFNFTQVTLKNFAIIKQKDEVLIEIKNLFQTSFSIFNLLILDCQNLIFSINIENPIKIEVENIEIINSHINNTQGLVRYSFSSNARQSQLKYSVKNFKISNSKFSKSLLFQQLLLENHNDQIITIEDLMSQKNEYQDSIIIYTNFQTTQRKSETFIKQLISKNDIFTSSSICTLHGALKVNLNEIIMMNANVYKQSQLFILPLFIIDNFTISNNSFHSLDSKVITNQVLSLYSDNLLKNIVIINNAKFLDNQYFGSRVFVELVISDNFKNLEVELTNITISQNILITPKDQFFQTSRNASFYFNLKNCQLKNIQIIKSFGFSEFSFNNVKTLIINQLKASTQNTYNYRVIHSQLTCINNISEIGMGSIIQMYNVENTQMKQLSINGIISFNQPIIQVKSLLKSNFKIFETIYIQDSQFRDNTLIKTKQEDQSSTIGIISEQEQDIKFIRVKFINNHLHCYLESLNFLSSSTILVQNTYANVNLQNSLFDSNVVTNSFSSNLVLIANQINLSYNNFTNQNILNYSNLNSRIVWGYEKSQTVYFENLQQQYPIRSKGGNGYLLGSNVEILNIRCNTSLAYEGGALYFVTQSEGNIIIKNSLFLSNSILLSSFDVSVGGTFYFDASLSQLNLTFIQNQILQSYSRQQGGAIYIEPSRQQNNILFQENFFNDIYSLFTPFLHLPVSFSSKNLSLHVSFVSCIFQNSYQGYLSFLGQLDRIKEEEIKLMKQSILIFIQQGSVSFQYVSFTNFFDFGLLHIENPKKLDIQNFFVQNITLLSEFLVQINFDEKQAIKMTAQNLQFDNIIEYQGEVFLPHIEIIQLSSIVNKCKQTQIQPKSIRYFFDEQYYASRGLINFYIITKSKNQYFSFIQLNKISIKHQILFNLINLVSLKCQSCQEGLFSIKNIEEQKKTTLIKFNFLKIEKCQCGISCLFLSSQEILLKNDKFRLLDSFEKILESQIFNIEIMNSYFDNNIAKYGGALYVQKVSLLIAHCQFIQNKAQFGGAAYIDNDTGYQFLIVDSLLANNTAKAGGGFYLKNYTINQPQIWNNQFYGNSAEDFGSSIADTPFSLTLQINDEILSKKVIVLNKTNVTEEISIDEYLFGNQTYKFLMIPSGQRISEYLFFNEKYQNYTPIFRNFSIVPLNSQNEPIKSLYGSECQIQSKYVLKEKESELSNQYTNLNYIQFNLTTQDYNLNELIIVFDPDLSQQGYLQLQITCDSVKRPVFNDKPPYLFNHYFINYRLLINFQTFPCQRGESKSNDGSCKVCDSKSDQYTLIAGEKCLIKDQITTEEVTSARIKLRPQYWRPYELSQNIEFCLNNPDNCVGGWNPGNDLCSLAHIGALCEQCDLYDTRGQGQYSVSTQYKCGSCEQIGDNATKITLISIWTMISIFLSVKGTVAAVEKMVAASKFSKLYHIVEDRKLGYGSVLLKVLTNYLQIIGSVTTFKLQIPSGLSTSIKAVGNPVDTMSYSQDCLLIAMSDIDIIYFRMIWALILPLIYSLAFGILYILAILANAIQKNKSALTTTMIYLFTYLQPTLLAGFISLLSFRKISDYLWIQGNVSYRYDTDSHKKWILSFILPSTSTLALFIPIYMFMSLYSRRFSLDKEDTRKNWGYLYNEYSKNAYFWEIIKILQKGFMIVFLTFYDDQIIIKASLIFLILFLYLFLTKRFRPYKLPFLNFLDEVGTLICGSSTVMAMSIYQANFSNNQEIIWPFLVLLIIINSTFIIFLIWQILWAQLNDNEDKIDKVRNIINQKFPNIKKQNQFLKQLLTNRTEQKNRIKKRYLKIKKYLLYLVHSHPGIYKLPESFQKSTIDHVFLHSPNSDTIAVLTNISKPSKNYQVSDDIIYHLQRGNEI